jgi:GTP-sensing pleiotropic transcriptional regulator CodY
MELKSDGSVGYSDASQEILAYLMSEYDTSGQMKKDLIYKLIDEEASKSSVGVRNTKSQLHSRSEDNNFVV